MRINRCADCRYFWIMRCRRFPPVATSDVSSGQPMVREDDTCGEWRSKDWRPGDEARG